MFIDAPPLKILFIFYAGVGWKGCDSTPLPFGIFGPDDQTYANRLCL